MWQPGLGDALVCFAHDVFILQLVMTKTRPSIYASLFVLMLSLVVENNPASAQVHNYFA